ALDDPLVRRVDVLLEILVREDAVGDVYAEAGDADPLPVRGADHDDRSTANVSVPRTASSPFTVARALPLPIGPRTVSRSHSSISSSPGRTTRLKRTSSIPAKRAMRPRFSASLSTATAPAWASASTIFTPGMIGLPGKCPAQSS